MLVIDIFDDASFFQLGGTQAPLQCAVLFPEPLLIDQQAESFFEAQLCGVSSFQLCSEGVCHAVQFHRLELVQRGLI